MIREKEGKPTRYTIDRQYNVDIPVKLAGGSVTWLIIE
jgi:hypothetical protein